MAGLIIAGGGHASYGLTINGQMTKYGQNRSGSKGLRKLVSRHFAEAEKLLKSVGLSGVS